MSIVDRFDRLCNPVADTDDPMTPSEVLALMFRQEGKRYDPALLGLFIKLLGVYPPGTFVQLSDGSLAMSVAPTAQSLAPKVLVYSPESARDDAVVLDLSQSDSLKVTGTWRASKLPKEVRDWFDPQHRLSYYFSTDLSPLE